MDYDVVKTSVQNAYKNFGQKDDKFHNAMYDYYKEGKKNPSVAKIIMQSHISKNRMTIKQMLKDAAALDYVSSSIFYPEFMDVQNRLYLASVNAAIKNIDAEDLYKSRQGSTVANSNGGFDKIRESFDTEYENLYPKTGKIRERIINANRLDMDLVTRKADWYQKINYAKTTAEYMKDYPKSFSARCKLILDNQINGDGVTGRVKSWFKRMMYKNIIKDGFCFKK